MTAPDGARWRVRRVWAPRLGTETVWGRLRRRMRKGRRFMGRRAADAADVPDPGCLSDAADELALVLVAVVVLVFLFFVGIPFVLAIIDLALFVVLTLLGIGARVVFRRPWLVEARGPDGQRVTWRVVGWRDSGETVDAAANALTHGLALPSGGESSAESVGDPQD